MSMSANTQFSVSVVIPAYNAEGSIRQAINSVLNQTHQPDEIIVVDDGSMDNTQSIIGEYGDKIIDIRQANAGASVARNTGVERAAGKWIAFLDADDEWLPAKLEIQIKHLKSNLNLVWSYSNYWIDSDNGQGRKVAFSFNPLVLDDVISDYLDVHVGYCIRTSTLIIQKQVLIEAGSFAPGQKWEDTDLFLKLAYKHPMIGYLNSPLVVYQSDSPMSLTSQHRFYAKERCELIERHLNLSCRYNRQDKFIKCASKIVQYWIRVALQYHNYKDARIMIFRLWNILTVPSRWQLAREAFLPHWSKMLYKAVFFLRYIKNTFRRIEK